MELRMFPLTGIGEIQPGDDLASVIAAAAAGALRDGDILAVTSKVVSKAEDRFVSADDREQAIIDETVRVVASRVHPGGTVRIVENRLGIIAAAAGVDNSNVPPGTVLLLPTDPDRSARGIRQGIRRQLGIEVGVVITDTLGRPWRMGQTDAAIGVAGVPATLDLRGTVDDHGQEMRVTVTAVVDEIAAAADLVKGKTSGCPVAVVRGLGHLVSDDVPVDQDGASVLIRPRDEDMFHLGAAESWNEGYRAALRDHGLPDPEDQDREGDGEPGPRAGLGTRPARTGG